MERLADPPGGVSETHAFLPPSVPTAVLHIATANVLSLDPVGMESARACGLVQSGRMHMLQQDLLSLKVHVCGLQETRTCGPEVRRMASYIAFSSGSTGQRSHGCELWLQTEEPWLIGYKRYSPKPSDFAIVHAEPTILIASGNACGCSLAVVVAHAPPSDDPIRVDAWWGNFDRQLDASIDAETQVAWLLDANARLGSCISPAVGCHSPSRECAGGERLRHAADRALMYLPQTFPGSAIPGDASTWFAKQGKGHRIDYLCVPVQWEVAAESAGPRGEVDISDGNLDHALVMATLWAPMLAGVPLFKRRTPVCSAADLQDPARSAVLGAVLRQGPCFPWRTSPSDALACWTVYCRKALAVISPRAGVVRRKPWISDATIALMRERAALRRSKVARFHEIGGVFEEAKKDPVIVSCTMRVKEYSVSIRTAARLDKASYLTEQIVQAQEANARGDSRLAHKILRNLKPSQPRRAISVLDESGLPTRGPLQARQRWQRHFAEALKGHPTSFAELQAAVDVESASAFASLTRIEPQGLELIPSVRYLTQRHARRRLGRAFGEDSLLAPLYRLHPVATAIATCAPMAKISLTLHTPWCGEAGSWQSCGRKHNPPSCAGRTVTYPLGATVPRTTPPF